MSKYEELLARLDNFGIDDDATLAAAAIRELRAAEAAESKLREVEAATIERCKEICHIPIEDECDYTPKWIECCRFIEASIDALAPDRTVAVEYCGKAGICKLESVGQKRCPQDCDLADGIRQLPEPASPLLPGLERAACNCLQDLSEAIAAIGKYGFDKDVTKDETAFTLWTNLNTAQAQAKQTLAEISRLKGEGSGS